MDGSVCCITSDPVSEQVDENENHMQPVVVSETLNLPR